MPAQEFPAKRLSRDEFASAIQKGLGRAMLHVMHDGVDDVADLVLDACLHNYTYDVQCEDGRSDWLFEMISRSPRYPEFRKAILDGLTTASDENDLDQLCDLAWTMAEKGDAEAREALRRQAFNHAAVSTSQQNWAGPGQWVALVGISGLLDLAKVYGRRLLSDPADRVPEWLHSIQMEESTHATLREQAAKDPEIKAYLDFLEANELVGPMPDTPTDRDAFRRQMREKYSLERVLYDATHKIGDDPAPFVDFTRYAEPHELSMVYDKLMRETDPAVRLRLLWVFRRTPPPVLDDILFQWAQGADNELRSAAIAALSNMADPRIHDLARSKVTADHLIGPDNEVIDLFMNNYHSADAPLIAQALNNLNPDRDAAHTLVMSLNHLSKKYNDPALAPALVWGYEHTPCCICRASTIDKLIKLGQITDALRHECLHDADEAIRGFAKGSVSD